MEDYLISNLIDIADSYQITIAPHKKNSTGLLLENIVKASTFILLIIILCSKYEFIMPLRVSNIFIYKPK